jgi:membrane protease subunit (stomatin/prohibitin family)
MVILIMAGMDMLGKNTKLKNRNIKDNNNNNKRSPMSASKIYKEFMCPNCGCIAICGTCGNWWCPHCKTGRRL